MLLAGVSRDRDEEYQVNRFAVGCVPVHRWLRDSRVPVLAVWGRNDEIFGPDGATAFLCDAEDTHVELLGGGHFLLEPHLDEVARIIREWTASTFISP